VLSDSGSVEKEIAVCHKNLPSNGQSELNDSFIVPLEESFTESNGVESLKRNISASDTSPDDSKFCHDLFSNAKNDGVVNN